MNPNAIAELRESVKETDRRGLATAKARESQAVLMETLGHWLYVKKTYGWFQADLDYYGRRAFGD